MQLLGMAMALNLGGGVMASFAQDLTLSDHVPDEGFVYRAYEGKNDGRWRLELETPLTDGPLDVDRIELSASWYLMVGGIGFSHDPYDVAAYGVGFVDYVLPWDALQPWLRDGAPVPWPAR